MSLDTNILIVRLFISALIGLIVGLEREKSLQINNEEHSIGIRSNILIGVFGGISMYFSTIYYSSIFIISFITTIIISLIPIFLERETRKFISYKSSISFILVFLLGGLAFLGEIKVALTVAIIITFVLSIKYSLHKFIQTLNYSEIIDALIFIIIAFIILPFLPNKAYDQDIINYILPNNFAIEQNISNINQITISSNELTSNIYNLQTNILNPYVIWLLVVLISGINFLGYILVKLFGKNNAFSLTGMIGGLYSSSATALHLAITSKKNKKIYYSFASGMILASGSSMIKLFILINTINSEFSLTVLPSLLIMLGYLYLSGSIIYLYGKKTDKNKNIEENPDQIKSPLNLKSAIQLTLLIITAMLIANITLHFANINYYYLFSSLIAFFTIGDPVIISTTDLVGKTFAASTAKNLIIIIIYLNILQKVATTYIFGNRKIIKPLAYTFFGLLLVTILCILYL